ncbi:MAG TPA: DUF3052 domain-containing protein [Solirubrobacteraceae bacterium]|nr:DUF3052 domain-containing protein [Solirubrobacteraceae bacterium]
MTAGYSGTPLPNKLGVKEGARVAWLSAPDHFEELLGELPPGVGVSRRLGTGLDVVVQFATSRAELRRRLPRLKAAIFPDGAAWVSWPKRSSGVATDITEDTIREDALPLGLVDVKVAAVDETWSGLKLVVRRELRG